MSGLNKILLICQSTQECRKAIDFSIDMAEQFKAELFILHTYHNVFGLEGWNLPIPKRMVEEGFQKMQANTLQEIEVLVANAREKDINVHILLREGKLIEKLFEFIKQNNIDLLVLPAHPEWRLEHFFFGRHNEEILRKLPCSVTFVKVDLEPVE